ncbi:MAG TPA: transglycosylase SLT domain-containing protein [Terriglobales bacterium]|nr:transglycosylase SLT domain-containing protein [Terriglobales bacterium]
MGIRKLYLLIAGPIALVLATVGCQTAQRATPLLPPKQANAPALPAQPQPSAETNPAPPLTPEPPKEASKQDQAADLVVRVEEEYQAGVENYKAGKTEAAQTNFDHAFDLLLKSPLDIRTNERLQQEFDHLVAGVDELEHAATPKPDVSAAEQTTEPAPIDETNEITVPVDPNVKAKAAAEVKATPSDLPLMLTDPVASYITYFSTRGRGTLEHALARSGRYQEMIQRVLKEEGVPQDLIFLAQAESGFHPLAVSRAGARGIWQFMGSRAKGYGLEKDFWADDRQDPEKSTRAAARHLKDLYAQFGDWYLAMAAYNSGPGTVQSAVKRTGYADFWELYKRNVLPKETRNYVPIIVAMTIMNKNPAQYGLDKVTLEKPVAYDKLKINYAVDLRLVAGCVDASPADLLDMNPSLLRYSTPKDHQFELHLPVGTVDAYRTAIAAIPQDMRVWWRYRTVAQGDTLMTVARTNHTTARAIAEANHLDLNLNAALDADSKLIIPVAPGKHAASEDNQTYARAITHYKVRKGDTVQSVAENFGISAKMVRRWNHLKGDSLGGRRILYVHLPVTPNAHEIQHVASSSKPRNTNALHAANQKNPLHHTVKPGETLYSIASTYNTTVASLKRANANVADLRPGMILLIR